MLRDGVFPLVAPAKSIFKAKVPWPGGMRSIARSSINTRCWTWRSDGSVFWRAGLSARHGRPCRSYPSSHCFPVSFSGEMCSGERACGAYSRRQRSVDTTRVRAVTASHLEARKYLKRQSRVRNIFSRSSSGVGRPLIWGALTWARRSAYFFS